MRRLTIFLLLPVLLLAGCARQDAPSAETSLEGRPLTEEEIEAVNTAFASWVEEEGVVGATPVSGFFTSHYDDVRQLSFPEFLYYFPGDGVLGEADQAEFAALAALPDFPFREGVDTLGWASPEDLPVPVHRITRASVDAALERYAGITSADLADTSGVLWLEEYDAWYTFTSDFGPGVFACAGGYVDEDGGTALLWSEADGDGGRTELTLGKDGEDWHIRAFRAVPGAEDPGEIVNIS